MKKINSGPVHSVKMLHALVCGIFYLYLFYIFAHVHSRDSVVEIDSGTVIIIDRDTVLKYAFVTYLIVKVALYTF